MLFDSTIKDNITFGLENAKTIADSEVEMACKQAGVSEFYDDKLRFPYGLYTDCGSSGSKLSGGQV